MRVSQLVLLCLLINLFACTNENKALTLRVGHTLDTEHSVHKGLAFMADRLEYYSKGQMTLKLYPNGQLGAEREMVELLQIGSLAMTKVSAATLESFVEDMRLFGLPYVFKSRDHRWQILESDIGEQILGSLAPANLMGIGYFDAGSRSFYICDRPTKSPTDVEGVKVRVMNSQNAVKMVSAFGGSPTPISWGELYAALQQGVVDGAENNPPSFYTSRHYEICPFYSLNEHTSVPDVIIVSKHVFDKLDEEQKFWLKQAMKDASTEQKRLWLDAENYALTKVKEAGVQINYPDKQPFIDAVSSLHNEYSGTVVGDYLEQIAAMEVQ